MKLVDIKPKLCVGNTYVCDVCSHTFTDKEVIVEKQAMNVQFAGLLSIRKVRHKNKDYLIACPKCKQVHLFGFDKAGES